MSALKQLGGLLRQYRLEAGLTQSDLSRHVHYDHTTISRIESGKLLPPDGYLPLFIEALHHIPATPSRPGPGLSPAERDELTDLGRKARAEAAHASNPALPAPAAPLFADEADLAPFVVGPPITHPRQFFGRAAELKRIFSLWRQRPLQHVVLLGPKRSGKTSLLYHLKDVCQAPASALRPDQRRDWLAEPERYRWAYADFQNPRLRTPAGLFAHLLEQLGLPTPEPCTLITFTTTLERLPAERRALILLDEIGAAFQTPEFEHAFWETLRALGTTTGGGQIGFVVATHRPLVDLMSAEGLTSPFHNIFGHTLPLGPFPAAEARALLAAAPVPLDAESAEWILTHSRGWPVILQKLCMEWENAREEGRAEWRADALRDIQQPPYKALLADEPSG